MYYNTNQKAVFFQRKHRCRYSLKSSVAIKERISCYNGSSATVDYAITSDYFRYVCGRFYQPRSTLSVNQWATFNDRLSSLRDLLIKLD